jgi:hypothetical protein
MRKNDKNLAVNKIQNEIYTIRNQQVMVDFDLAKLYQVETRVLNQLVKRNKERFPEEFMFQLTSEEFTNSILQPVVAKQESLRSQTVTLKNKRGQHRKYLPYVFTEQGVAMLAGTLKSKIAIKVSIRIINSFVQMRRFLSNNAEIFSRLENVETKQIKHKLESDKNFQKIFKALNQEEIKAKQGIFYNGQIFDAYLFVSKIIKSANKKIVLVDNYIDETVLQLFTKRKRGVKVIIYTQRLSKILQQDLEKYNKQYQDKKIELKTFKKAHDRFIIVDSKVVYHFGASLKDLGKKWFAFSKLEMSAKNILGRLEK